MRYRIEIDSPRHSVRNEYFVEFRRTDLGQESIHTERDQATWMNLETARIALRRLREPKYNIRCRLLDEHGAVADDFNDTERKRPVDIFTSHEDLVWRDKFNGVMIEIPIVKNSAYDPPRYYFKFASGPDLTMVDRSIQGSSPAECFERFVGNPHLTHLVARYKVEDRLPAPEAPQSAVMITVPQGYQSVGFRPGSVR